MSQDEKKEIVFAMQSKSRRECEKQLAALDPEPFLNRDRERAVSNDLTEIRFVADDALLEKLQKIRELDAHVQSNPSYLELFHRMADLCLKKLDPTALKRRASAENLAKENSAPPAELKEEEPKRDPRPKASFCSHPRLSQRYIPAEVRRLVWRRDQGRCRYKSGEGKVCGSKYALQVDHIVPVAAGGQSEVRNLQLLCRTHNQLKAVHQFGAPVMNAYLMKSH